MVNPADIPNKEIDEDYEHFIYPDTIIGSIGVGHLFLTRPLAEDPHAKGIGLTLDTGEVLEKNAAFGAGYYDLNCEISHPSARFSMPFTMEVVIDRIENTAYGTMENESRDEEEASEILGSKMEHDETRLLRPPSWHISTGENVNTLFVKNDSAELSKLLFRFETQQ